MNIKGMKRDEQLQALHVLGVKTGTPSSVAVAANAAATISKTSADSASNRSKGGRYSLPALTLPISTRTKTRVSSPKKFVGIASNVKSLFTSASKKT